MYFQKHSIDSAHIRLQQQGQTEKTAHTVYRQPVALDRLSVHDINQTDATGTSRDRIHDDVVPVTTWLLRRLRDHMILFSQSQQTFFFTGCFHNYINTGIFAGTCNVRK